VFNFLRSAYCDYPKKNQAHPESRDRSWSWQASTLFHG